MNLSAQMHDFDLFQEGGTPKLGKLCCLDCVIFPGPKVEAFLVMIFWGGGWHAANPMKWIQKVKS